MTTQIAPSIILSGNGRLAVYAHGTQLDVITMPDGQITPLLLGHSSNLLAISPQVSFMVAAGLKELSLFSAIPPYTLLTIINIEESLSRLIVSDDGWLIGVTLKNGNQNSLWAWRYDTEREQIIWQAKQTLDNIFPFHLAFDFDTSQLLLWGLSGLEALAGKGERFIQLRQILMSDSRFLWHTKQLGIPSFNTLVFPLMQQQFGACDDEALYLLEKESDKASSFLVKAMYSLENIQNIVASPDGTYIAWYGYHKIKNQIHCFLRVAQVEDGMICAEGHIAQLGWFPSLAVDNKGQATLVYTEKSGSVHINMLRDRQLIQHTFQLIV